MKKGADVYARPGKRGSDDGVAEVGKGSGKKTKRQRGR